MDDVSKRIVEIWYETKILYSNENKNKHCISKEIADKIASDLSGTSIVSHSVEKIENFDSLYDGDLGYIYTIPTALDKSVKIVFEENN